MTAAITTDPAGGVTVLAAVAAGAVSFLSPCVLPLVPGYLSAVVGVAPADLERASKRRVLIPSLLFVASFSLVFILLGVGVTLFGSSFATHRQLLDKLAAATIIALGAIPSAAALSNSAAHGALLLAFYSAGLAIPFLLTALAFERMTSLFAVIKRHFRLVIATGGLVLIGMGALIWSGELFQLNIQAENALNSLGINFFNSI